MLMETEITDVNVSIYFINAIENNDLNMLTKIIFENFDLNTLFKSYCSYDYSIDVLTLLQENGVDISCRIYYIGEAMVKKNNLSGALYCLNNGVDIDYLLGYSVHSRNIDLVKYFLQNGANMSRVYVEDIYELMEYYSKPNGLKIISLLVEYGFPILSRIKYYAMKAVINDRPDILEYFTTIGLDLRDNDDELLMYAIIYSRKDLIEYLLENGADINARNNIALDLCGILCDMRNAVLVENNLLKNTGGAFESHQMILPTFKLLIKKGAISNNIENTFVSHIFTNHNNIDEEIFIWFLDNGLQICNKQLLKLIIDNKRSDIAVLCFKNGIILDITNDLINLAKCNSKLAEILMDLGIEIKTDLWAFALYPEDHQPSGY